MINVNGKYICRIFIDKIKIKIKEEKVDNIY